MTAPGGKNAGAAAMGRKGGLVRNPRKGMGSATAEERAERARVMVEAKRGKRIERAVTLLMAKGTNNGGAQ